MDIPNFEKVYEDTLNHCHTAVRYFSEKSCIAELDKEEKLLYNQALITLKKYFIIIELIFDGSINAIRGGEFDQSQIK